LILVRVTVVGEKGASTFSLVFEYSDESFETVFAPSVSRIKEKLTAGLRINTNECLALYCDYIVTQLRNKVSSRSIEHEVRTLLSHHNVMIGVPESLGKIIIQAELNKGIQDSMTVIEPITIPRYVMNPRD
jgi:urease gamma subunit